jgi:putative ABC transport system substrate-binding protein
MLRRQFLALLTAAAARLPARAESLPVIGFMSGRAPEDSDYLVMAFRDGLKEAGYEDGRNVAIELRWARGRYDLLPGLAAELVSRPVALLVGVGGDVSAVAAKHATSTIPIVLGMGGDPVAAGLVESLGRPGANATGFTLLTNEMEPKRLGLLAELVPGAELIGALLDPNFPPAERQQQELEAAARSINRPLRIAKAGNDAELNDAFAALLGQRVGALLVAADPYFDTRRDRIIAFAAENRLPALYQFRDYAVAGGLVSYGPSITEQYRQAGVYAGRILKGAKPADLPVLQPTKFEFVINLKTAKALGIEIHPSLFARADEVIE